MAIASIAPAAPSVWPSIDLFAVIASDPAWSPKIVLMAWSSALSPSGVEVAWALTCWTSLGSEAGLLEARAAPRGPPPCRRAPAA